MQGVVGAGGVSGVASKPLAAKAAPKAHETGQGRVIVFVVPYVAVFLWGDTLRQLISVLDALEHGNEVFVAVIEYLAGKALHLALNGTTAAK